MISVVKISFENCPNPLEFEWKYVKQSNINARRKIMNLIYFMRLNGLVSDLCHHVSICKFYSELKNVFRSTLLEKENSHCVLRNDPLNFLIIKGMKCNRI